ncbi:MAG: ankyrin repeat domain-containing protein [Planctomycetota bacterium]|jgi:ankyrin repeat protein
MNNKRLISLMICWILVVIPGICALSFADSESATNTEAQQHFEKANELRKLADYDTAITEYKKVINLSPKSKIARNAQYWIGQSYYEAGQFDAALSAFEKICDEYPASTIIPSTKQMIERVQQAKVMKLFFEAIKKGDIKQVKKLIAQGADLNEKDKKGWTPLHYAGWYGQGEVAKALIAKGANVNATDSSGKTPLHVGVRFGARYIRELLIAKGITVDVRDNSGNTPLHVAARWWPVGQNVLELLVVNGADVNARNDKGETSLHLATPWRNTIKQRRDIAAAFLLANGAEVNAKDNSGRIPLHFAAGSGNEKVVKLLLAKGADIKAKAADGTTALHWAARYGRYDVVELLLDSWAEVNDTQNDGWAALHRAAQTGHDTVAELLIARGADVNAESKEGKTPLDFAGLGGYVKLCTLLTAKGAKIHSLCSAAAVGDLAKVESFANEGSTTDEKNSALFAAAACGQENIVELLISKGAHVTARNNWDMTALHLAARGGYTDVAKQLLAPM